MKNCGIENDQRNQSKRCRVYKIETCTCW